MTGLCTAECALQRCAFAMRNRRKLREQHAEPRLDLLLGQLFAVRGPDRTRLGTVGHTEERHRCCGRGTGAAAAGRPPARLAVETSVAHTKPKAEDCQEVQEKKHNQAHDVTRSNIGGFFAAALSDGSFVDTSVQYSDDNAFAGHTLLESRALLLWPSPLAHLNQSAALAERCLEVARGCAAWLVSAQSGAWDWQGDGGFWWNVSVATAPDPPLVYGMRPDNSVALATLLFTQLAAVERELHRVAAGAAWLGWAERSAHWMWLHLYNSVAALLNWFVDQEGRANTAHFAYTNALAAAHCQRLSTL
mmetsp:Transcript_28681/g.72114  ORF Transcript_28681/g.72114 Transcript_28681/m.72114 type:complete len:305 (-) Transcript_28681:89-1003(-)